MSLRNIFNIIFFSAVVITGHINSASAQNITTIAGTGISNYTGDGSAAVNATFSHPGGLIMDQQKNLYFSDNTYNCVRKIDTAGIMTTFAGTGLAGYSGDGGVATDAQLNDPNSLAVDAAGNVYIADRGNHIIRKVTPAGIISTFAGTPGSQGFSGDNGLATSALLKRPASIAFDESGNAYIADESNQVIRMVNTAGIITTIAGTHGYSGFSGDGGLATAAKFSLPFGVAVDHAGNIYVSDYGNARIRKITTSGIISTIAGDGFIGYNNDNIPATAAHLNNVYGIALNAAGELFIADAFNYRIRKVDTLGIITTVAGTGTQGYSGDGGLAASAKIDTPVGITVNSLGDVYLGDNSHRLRKVTHVHSATGINNVEHDIALQVYPNPSNSALIIKGNLSAGNNNSVIVNIINSVGQVAYYKSITAKNGELNEQLQLGHALPEGNYMLMLANDKHIQSVHFVIKY